MQIYKATKYIRLSCADDRNSESDSVGNQRKLIDDFIQRNPDIEIVSERIDDGYSGVLFDRPAFNEMMEDVMSGKVNCVIVKDLSRFGREYIETGRFLRRTFPMYGVRFIAINDNIDTAKEGSGDDLSVSVKNIMNEAYCRDISVKTRSSLDAKRKNGDFVSPFTVYGYLRDVENKNRIVVDEYAASIVKDIFRMRLEGVSAARIAKNLNDLGVLSPLAYKKNAGLPYAKGGYADRSESKWSATTIIRILKDEIYTGVLVQGKKSTPNYKMRQLMDKPAEEWRRVEDTHQAIIEKHDFDLVQRLKKLDTRTAPGNDQVYLFSGILICGCCGGRMTRKTVPSKGKEYYYYYCPDAKKNQCTTPMVREEHLTECALGIVKSHVNNVVSLETLLEGINQERINRELLSNCATQISENETRLEQINAFKSTLYENMVSGILTKDEFMTLKVKYNNDAEHISEAIAKIRQEQSNILNNRSERNRWIEHFKRFSGMEQLDRKAVVQLIQSVKIIDKTNIVVSFNYEFEYEKVMERICMNERLVG